MTRKEELQRERNLVASHLAWLDLEIARLGEDASRVSSISTQDSAVPQAPAAPRPSRAPTVEEQAVTERLMQEQVESASRSVSEVKRGCLVAFSTALLLILGSVFLVYWMKYRG